MNEENNSINQENTVLEPQKNEENKKNKKNNLIWIIILFIILIAVAVAGFFLLTKKDNKQDTNKIKKDSKDVYSEYRLSGNDLENFDLYFLKLENTEKNKVYSPLSIKYALEMLAEGADGNSKKQLDAIIGDYEAKIYPNNEHMSFANAMFIRNEMKEEIKEEYTNVLKSKYNAEVIYDGFNDATTVNNWIKEKTFHLIDKITEDEKIKDMNFILTNALAIDMNWNNQIQCASGSDVPCTMYGVRYRHEKYKTDSEFSEHVDYLYEDDQFYQSTFNGKDKTKSANIKASFNRYDAVKEIGEDNIRKIVGEEYQKWLASEEGKQGIANGYAEPDVNKYLDKFIEELNENYKKEATSSDFLIYDDENVKAFAKDLKEYDGTTLQYVGIMPKKDKLQDYVKNVKAEDLNKVIQNLKELKQENFKDGVVTLINGYIPFFKYDYELNFIEDLQKLGIEDIFDVNKADLSKMLKSSKQYINEASHKAKIEFSNDGIKAGAATSMGGAGATSGGFNYLFEIPVEEIDMTFDNPYMYIIRDKKTGEVWFTGTVYEPITK